MSKNWIFLRGLARGAGHWADFPQEVKSSFPEDRFEFLELPGNGRLFAEKSPVHIADMVRALRGQSEFVKNGESFQLVGVSLGGMIASAWAEEFPREVAGLCVVNSSAGNVGRPYERLKWKNIPKLLHAIVEKSVPRRERRVLEMVANSAPRREAVLPAWITETEQHPIRAANLWRQLLAAGEYRFPAKPPVPAWLLGSEQDHFVSVECTKRLAKMWQRPLFLHPWAGHDLPLDDFKWTIDCLKKMQT
jgi:pimeloyl-ACP methyl ester carboxylesterase